MYVKFLHYPKKSSTQILIRGNKHAFFCLVISDYLDYFSPLTDPTRRSRSPSLYTSQFQNSAPISLLSLILIDRFSSSPSNSLFISLISLVSNLTEKIIFPLLLLIFYRRWCSHFWQAFRSRSTPCVTKLVVGFTVHQQGSIHAAEIS